MEAVVALRVRYQQALRDAADRAFSRANKHMDVVAHKAIAVQVEWFSLLQVRDRFQKRRIVAFAVKNRLAIVATVDDVVNQSVGNGAQGAWHSRILT